MEDKCRAILSKYVRADSVLRCLELAGFTTAHVLRCLDMNQLNEVETFVRHACSRMPEASRGEFVGELFALEPEEFRFPGGIRCGLLLGVEELRRELSSETNGRSSPLIITKETKNQVCQTDNHHHHHHHQQSSPNNSLYWKQEWLEDRRRITPSSAAAAALLNNGSHPISGVGGNVCSLAALQKQADSIMPPTSPAESSSTGSKASITTPVRSNAAPLIGGGGCFDTVNVEHLKHHATASIIRLASRQFVNGSLIKERDFDMNIELVATSDGQLRATGIFYCHLCRKKRERSSAVRFSIARNRYPVVSNVMSHLKSHFVYISPPPGTPINTGGGIGGSPVGSMNSWGPTGQQLLQQPSFQGVLSNVKQEMVFPGFMSPGSQSPLDFSGMPLNMMTNQGGGGLGGGYGQVGMEGEGYGQGGCGEGGHTTEQESDEIEEQEDDIPPADGVDEISGVVVAAAAAVGHNNGQ